MLLALPSRPTIPDLGPGALVLPRECAASTFVGRLFFPLLSQELLESVLVVLDALLAQRGGRRLLFGSGLLGTGLQRRGSRLWLGEARGSFIGMLVELARLRDAARLPLKFEPGRSRLRLLLGSSLGKLFLLIDCDWAEEVRRLLDIVHRCPP